MDLMRLFPYRPWQAALALIVAVALLGANAALATGRRLTLDTGGYGYLVRPTSIYYTGDGSGVIGVLRRGRNGERGSGRGFLNWERWSRRGAFATGTLWLKLGTPTATSPFTRFHVTVTATRVRHDHFSRMILRYRLNGKALTDTRCIPDRGLTSEWGILIHGRCG
jgi:hypothetical protein